jgi:hypothetical protein
MILALDFDDTYTRDEILWAAFVNKATMRGHSVTFVTSRHSGYDNKDIEQACQLLGIDVVYCEGQPKKKHFRADVWIDDCPEAIPLMENGIFV